MHRSLAGLSGTEPGEVRRSGMDVIVTDDGRLISAGIAFGHQTTEGIEVVLDGGPEPIKGWGNLNAAEAFYIRECYEGSRSLLVPVHEFQRIGVDPASLRKYAEFEFRYKADPRYHGEDSTPEASND